MTARSSRAETRNPVLALPAARAILELSAEIRRPLGLLLRQLADEAKAKKAVCLAKSKLPMAVYWHAVMVYAKHIAHAVDPASRRI